MIALHYALSDPMWVILCDMLCHKIQVECDRSVKKGVREGGMVEYSMNVDLYLYNYACTSILKYAKYIHAVKWTPPDLLGPFFHDGAD